MNKYIISTTTAVILSLATFTSCTSEGNEPAPPDPADVITFGSLSFGLGDISGVGAPHDGTRSVLVNKFGPEGVSEFKVWGYCVPRDVKNEKDDWDAANVKWTQKSSYSRPDVFKETSVSISGTSASYGPNHVAWKVKDSPTTQDLVDSWDYYYTFIACANGGGRFSMSNTDPGEMGAPTLTYSMPFAGGVFDTSLDHNEISDALISAVFDHTRRNGKVNFAFYHILTGLRFRFLNHSDKPMTIHSVKFSGRFYRTGTFSFAGTTLKRSVADLDTDSYSGKFTLLDNDLTVPEESGMLLGYSTDNPDGTTLLLLPNPDATPNTAESANPVYSLGDNKTITIEYTLNGDRRIWVNKDFKLSYIPGANVRHTANFNFVGNEFVVVFQADNNLNWEGMDNDIEIN